MNNAKYPDALTDLRNAIKSLISEQGYPSIEKFCHEHSIEQSILSRFLSGKREMHLSTFFRIAEALEMDLGPTFYFAKRKGATPTPNPRGKAKVIRRTKVTILLSETSAIEIKRDEGDSKPLVLRFE